MMIELRSLNDLGTMSARWRNARCTPGCTVVEREVYAGLYGEYARLAERSANGSTTTVWTGMLGTVSGTGVPRTSVELRTLLRTAMRMPSEPPSLYLKRISFQPA